jgi:hypothetical protein
METQIFAQLVKYIIIQLKRVRVNKLQITENVISPYDSKVYLCSPFRLLQHL